MKGYIRRRGKRSYSLQWYIGRDEDGKPQYRTKTVHGTRKAADAEMARIVHEIETGAYVDASHTTVARYLEDWLAAVASSLAPKTHERYAEIVSRHLTPALGRRGLSKLRPIHIQAYYTQALQTGRRDGKGGLSAQTVLHHHRLLRKALHDAVRWQMLARNPCESVEPPRVGRAPMRVLTHQEVRQLLRITEGTWLHVPVLLAVTTGMRRGEILALKWEDVDLERSELYVRHSLEETRAGLRLKQPKSGKARRRLALPDSVTKVLRAHKGGQKGDRRLVGEDYEEHDLVCAQADGSYIQPEALSRRFPELLRNRGLPTIPFHSLRHTHATLLLLKGVHPKVVQERLGHSTIGITLDTYSHVLPSMQAEAAAQLNSLLDDITSI